MKTTYPVITDGGPLLLSADVGLEPAERTRINLYGALTEDAHKAVSRAVHAALQGVHCKVSVDFCEDVQSGDSCCLAIAVAVRALLKNKSIRPWLAFTGGVSSGGIVTPVGDVEDKRKAVEAAQHTLIAPAYGSFDNPAIVRVATLHDACLVALEE